MAEDVDVSKIDGLRWNCDQRRRLQLTSRSAWDNHQFPVTAAHDGVDIMLVIKIELWPAGGDARRVVSKGYATIVNDGSGTLTAGNYKVAISQVDGDRPWKEGQVKGFPRKRLGAWDLLYRALREVVGERNK